MNDLATIISVVLAVSGSTFAALFAFQTLIEGGTIGKGLKYSLAMSDEHLRAVVEASISETLTKSAVRKHRSIQRWWRVVWRLSIGAPVVLFMLTSFSVSVHVCIAYWNAGPTPTTAWQTYKWVLLVLIAADGLCVVAPVLAYLGIRFGSANLEELFRVAMEAEASSLLRPRDIVRK